MSTKKVKQAETGKGNQASAQVDTLVRRACPECGKVVEYIEFECDEPYTAPAELRFKALDVWGMYDTPKQTICENSEFVHFSFANGHERLVKMIGFNREEYERKMIDIRETRKPCEQEKCREWGYPIFSAFEPDNPLGYYCEDHMRENGACPGCHQYLAGFESFEFSESEYCGDCEDAIRDEIDDDDYMAIW